MNEFNIVVPDWAEPRPDMPMTLTQRRTVPCLAECFRFAASSRDERGRTPGAPAGEGRLGKYFEDFDAEHRLNALMAASIDAMRELGLEVVEAKIPVDTLVVDHVEKIPSEN
jgi:hypothetical protein